MKTIAFSEFNKNPDKFLNAINKQKNSFILSRPEGKVVLLDFDEYNALQETLYLTSTFANQRRLEDSLAEMKGNL
ncbi:MAG: type II toxin-antitoxin system Phd/YefM family antitoxin [Flavipsychrobacter sp.]|nr:type II toxin-antitoxin system Phd/YefM family antitoxin [Flavipsychrobacter sp.]